MNFLFRKNASGNEKLLTILYLISIISLLYGLLTNISPSDLVQEYWPSPVFALTLLYFMPLLLDRHQSNKIPSLPFQKRFIFYSSFLLFSFTLAFVLIVYSLPSLFTSIAGQPHEFSSVIERKNTHFKGCKHEIKLNGIGYGIHNSQCVNSSFWKNANEGDVVYVYSLKSALGIKVTGVEEAR